MGIGLDTDCSTNRVFWCDISAKQILSSKYDGSDKKVFIDEGISFFLNIVVAAHIFISVFFQISLLSFLI